MRMSDDEIHGEFPPANVAHGDQPEPLAPVAHGGCRTDGPVLNAHPSTPVLAERIRELMAQRICELHGTLSTPERLESALSLPDVLTTLAWDVARELQRPTREGMPLTERQMGELNANDQQRLKDL